MMYDYVDENVEVTYFEGKKIKKCKGLLRYYDNDFIRLDKNNSIIIINRSTLKDISKL